MQFKSNWPHNKDWDKLSGRGMRVYTILVIHANTIKGNVTWHSLRKLSTMWKIDRRTLQLGIDELIKFNLIEPVSGHVVNTKGITYKVNRFDDIFACKNASINVPVEHKCNKVVDKCNEVVDKCSKVEHIPTTNRVIIEKQYSNNTEEHIENWNESESFMITKDEDYTNIVNWFSGMPAKYENTLKTRYNISTDELDNIAHSLYIRRTVIKLPNSELKELIVKLIDHYINLYTERL